jgi:hypothetical protein
MPEQVSNAVQLLRSKLEDAILRFRSNSGKLLPTSIESPDFEHDSALNEQILKARLHNAILLQRYQLALHCKKHNKRLRRDNPKYRVASFLFDYFGSDFEAIELLENVSPTNIEQLTVSEINFLLKSRANNPFVCVQGLNNQWTDELWEGVVNPDDLLSPQEWLAQLFDQPPESTLQSRPILKRSRPTDPDPKQLIITKRVRFRNGSSSMREHEYSPPEPERSVIVDLSQKRGDVNRWLSGESV